MGIEQDGRNHAGDVFRLLNGEQHIRWPRRDEMITDQITRTIRKRFATLPNWLQHLTAASFLFFLAKGLLWIGLAAWVIL
ncbi:MAG: hypothetical protein AB2535_11490 [Candidatus Thiodiazotropha endolucinida]